MSDSSESNAESTPIPTSPLPTQPVNDFTQSPYYLHPCENPCFVLISPQLNNTNYHSWSRNMKHALISKNKIKFINGKLPTPEEEDPMFDYWERCNSMVVSWITRTLSPQIAQSVLYIDNAKVLWDELCHRFTKGTHFKLSDLLQEIHSMKQGERSVNEFFTDMKIVCDDLEALRPNPICSCNDRCNCDAFKIMHNQREIEYAICFLKGLNDSYSCELIS
jgi:hypothetical protein